MGKENETKREGQTVNVRQKGGDGFHLKRESLPCICQSADRGLVANGNVEGS